eukprot:gene6836-3240_t
MARGAMRKSTALYTKYKTRVHRTQAINPLHETTGKVHKRRLWGGVKKTMPTQSYWLNHEPFGQFMKKKFRQSNAIDRILPDEQRRRLAPFSHDT